MPNTNRVLTDSQRWLLISALTAKAESDGKLAQQPEIGPRLAQQFAKQAIDARKLAADVEQSAEIWLDIEEQPT